MEIIDKESPKKGRHQLTDLNTNRLPNILFLRKN